MMNWASSEGSSGGEQNFNSSVVEKFGNATQFFNIDHVNVVPNSNDILSIKGLPLDRNIVTEPFPNVDVYLSIHFRLLLEDVMQPFRKAIANLREDPDANPKEVRLYKNAKFAKSRGLLENLDCYVPDCETSWRCYKINFSPLRHVDWKRSKRLIHGSLVCLWDKKEEFIIGITANNSPEDLSSGHLIIAIGPGHLSENFLDKTFLMIESVVFYEPYRAVLQALKLFTPEQFPLVDYVLGHVMQRRPPSYLKKGGRTPYVVRDVSHNRSYPVLQPLESESWPSARQLGLDEKQHSSLIHALTSQVSLVQGPPGTGKTFLALQIVKILLENASFWQASFSAQEEFQRLKIASDIKFKPSMPWSVWNKKLWNIFGPRWRDPRSPILVVCLTNHALDQFLEGMLTWTENIVRLGGQSKSEAMNQFNLKSVKQNAMNIRSTKEYTNSNYFHYRSKMISMRTAMKRRLESINKEMKRLTAELPSLYELKEKGIICPSAIHWLENNLRAKGEKALKHWLRWDNHRQLKQIARELRINLLNSIANSKNEHQVDVEEESGLENHSPDKIENIEDDENSEDILADLSDDDLFGDIFDGEDQSIETASGASIESLSRQSNEHHQSPETFFNEQFLTEDEKDLRDFAKRQRKKIEDIRYFLCNLPSQADVQFMDTSNLASLTRTQAWQLFSHWRRSYREAVRNSLEDRENFYEDEIRKFNELKGQALAALCRGASVVGMTTTGAAKNRKLLEALRCKIVIVEEAAEVLESHVICSLTADCQQLIMIGDHQQLRPSVNVQELEKDYHLDISLFERLINVGLEPDVLGVQHRMRPEIARLITPAIYPDLKNAAGVYNRPDVVGLLHNVFFYHHESPERQEENSFFNVHEAEMTLGLAAYICGLKCFPQEKVTILTTYASQLRKLQELRRNKWPWLQQLRITVVDNYQGEENEIVILSLVRSNSRSSIGFLATPNRVCVALSRARCGFYILGNMALLSKKSSLWDQLKRLLIDSNQVGTAFPLCCERHRDSLLLVTKREDFPLRPFCKILCGFAMDCGHPCPLSCHEGDLHIQRCQELLTVTLSCGHEVSTMCSNRHESITCSVLVETSEPCGHLRLIPCYQRNFAPCPVRILKSRPCGHQAEVSCSNDDFEGECLVDVQLQLSCTHLKMVPCGLLKKGLEFAWESLCQEMVSKELPCGHRKRIKCKTDPIGVECGNLVEEMLECGHMGKLICRGKSPDDLETFPCKETVNVKLPCGHNQRGPCSSSFKPCKEQVERLLPCKHTAVVMCSEKSPLCNFFLLKTLRCGHEKALPCHEEVDSVRCDELVTVQRPSCSHLISVRCHLRSNVDYLNSLDCKKWTPRTLPCGHESLVPCGALIQNVMCKVDVKIVLHCGHENIVPCFEASKQHRDLMCAVLVRKTLLCGHSKEMPCSQVPDLECCFQPTDALLPCGHSVRKICGESLEPDDNSLCHVIVSKQLLCGHYKDMPCYRDDNVCVMAVKQKFDCGHSVNTPCAEAKANALCKKIVEKKLPCGHSAKVECYIPEEQVQCDFPYEHRFACGHTVITACSVPIWKRFSLQCPEKQMRELPCGHRKEVTCGSLNAEKSSKQLYCRQQIQKVITDCGHKIMCDCGMNPTRENCKAKCKKQLKCGHPCKLDCSDNCDSSLCEEVIDVTSIRLACGHPVKGPCYLRYGDESVIESWKGQVVCTSICGEILDCGHRCPGKCSECKLEYSHAVCKFRCKRTLVCGHKCEAQCAVACPPCKKRCSYECIHGPCKNACCEDCSSCEKPCAWRCPHAKCDHRCGDSCNRKPCNEPCPKTLGCGHRCIGLCGELCPEKCHNCSCTIIENFDSTQQYVYLQCGHWIEVNEMDRWIFKQNEHEQDTGAIDDVEPSPFRSPCCPICRKTVVKCFRYGDVLKEFMGDLPSVKLAFVEDEPENVGETLRALTNLIPEMQKFNIHAPLEKVINDIRSVKSCNHNQHWDAANRSSLAYEWSCLVLDVKRKYFGSIEGKKFELQLSDADAEQIATIALCNLKKISNVRSCGADFCLNLSDICSRLDLLRQILVIKTAPSHLKAFLGRELKHVVAMAESWFDKEDFNVEFLTEWFASVAKESKLKLTGSVKSGCELVQRYSMSEDVWKKCQKPNCGEVYCDARFDYCQWC